MLRAAWWDLASRLERNIIRDGAWVVIIIESPVGEVTPSCRRRNHNVELSAVLRGNLNGKSTADKDLHNDERNEIFGTQSNNNPLSNETQVQVSKLLSSSSDKGGWLLSTYSISCGTSNAWTNELCTQDSKLLIQDSSKSKTALRCHGTWLSFQVRHVLPVPQSNPILSNSRLRSSVMRLGFPSWNNLYWAHW